MPGCDLTAGAGIIWWHFSFKCLLMMGLQLGLLTGATTWAFPCGLGFLAEWQCQGIWICYMAALGKRDWAYKVEAVSPL